MLRSVSFAPPAFFLVPQLRYSPPCPLILESILACHTSYKTASILQTSIMSSMSCRCVAQRAYVRLLATKNRPQVEVMGSTTMQQLQTRRFSSSSSSMVLPSSSRRASVVTSRNIILRKPASPFLQQSQRRYLETEAEFHSIADQALEAIQDAVDVLLDSQTYIEYDSSLSSGVLTIKLGEHGTWVINKQTPNRQLWVRN